MQSPQSKKSTMTGAGLTARGRTQRANSLPIRYHPSITVPTPGHGAPATNQTSQTQKTRKSDVRPPGSKTATKAQQESHSANSSNASRTNRAPDERPLPRQSQKQRQRAQNRVENASEDPDPPQTPQPMASQIPKANKGGPVNPVHLRPEDVDFSAKLPKDVVEEVEIQTRGQRTNQNWFAWRKNRITASKAHQVSHSRFVNGKSDTPAPYLIDAITGQKRDFPTRAMTWGIENEAKAIDKYKELKSGTHGQPVSVQDCGLFIDPNRPWLAGTPDGIVTDTRTGQRLLCLEVKCPHKHKDRTVEDACKEDPNFCLQLEEDEGRQAGDAPVYRLKKSHCYYTQIQCQLALTRLQQAELVVFTLKETAIVPVTFDPDLWEETVSKLEMFFKEVILPLVESGSQVDVAAAVRTPEQ